MQQQSVVFREKFRCTQFMFRHCRFSLFAFAQGPSSWSSSKVRLRPVSCKCGEGDERKFWFLMHGSQRAILLQASSGYFTMRTSKGCSRNKGWFMAGHIWLRRWLSSWQEYDTACRGPNPCLFDSPTQYVAERADEGLLLIAFAYYIQELINIKR